MGPNISFFLSGRRRMEDLEWQLKNVKNLKENM